MKQHLGHLSKLKVLRSSVSRAPVLLLIALTAWSGGLAMAELNSENELEQVPGAISWPMLPGESLNQLATLFYPKNKSMQRRFVAKTKELSHELNPTLDANAVFTQPGMLVIPELKVLARHAPLFNSRPRKSTALRMSYQIESIVTPEMHVQYQDLVQRNEFLKQELERLQQRLSGMQETLVQLKSAVLAFIRVESPVTPKPVPKPVPHAVQKPAEPIQKVNLLEPSVRPPISNPEPTKKLAELHAQIDKVSADSLWVRVLIEFLMIIVGLVLAFMAWFWVRKRLFGKIEAATNEQFEIIGRTLFHSVGDSSFDLTSDPFERAQDDILSIEESSIVDEARILVSMDRPAKAISVLLNYVGAHPKASLHPWLYLLELYRKEDRKDEFIAVAKRLHTTLNVMTPQWEETEAAIIIAHSLEEFPHIIAQLTEAWAAGKAQQYLTELLEDNREGERAGFSLEVSEEIMLLKDVWDIRALIPN